MGLAYKLLGPTGNMWDIMGNICERAQCNLWAYVGIFWEWANEIKARKCVPQQYQKGVHFFLAAT